ncbi:PRTRC system protein A [Sphingopyxis panaciterrulae]|uniref:PRTRC genetic system protein A n=1 Tax=Sphingopyxis panaciterrulae TaxID=462372 RepID=A0A7W9B6S3_9SPHN|nr:PRTRC system protein A [Sphingopyxis panaciterrulae]MBB5707330.1 PRTRC genetic system protein A [Sphingopyxis panaciterrulae]
MIDLADDPTAAALLAVVPCHPVPVSGTSPALDALRAARAGHGLAVGHDGVMLILRRPWLAVDVPVTMPIAVDLPYGSIGEPGAVLRCGLIPGDYFGDILEHFRAALPNEEAAFILWNEETGAFALHFPVIDEATPSRLVYRTPVLDHGWHVVCDIHSHGSGAAFFSATDDADDAHVTKISLVIGRLGHPEGPLMASRLCAGGLFLPLPRSPFSGDIQCRPIPILDTIFPAPSTIARSGYCSSVVEATAPRC